MKTPAACAMLFFALFVLASRLSAQDGPVSPVDSAAAPLPRLSPSIERSGARFDTVRVREQQKRAIPLRAATEVPARPGGATRESTIGEASSAAPNFSPSMQNGRARTAYGRLGLGVFLTPFAEGWYAQQFEAGDIAAHALFENSQGHVDGAGYTKLRIDANGGSFLPSTLPPLLSRSRIEGDAHVSSDVYRLYAALHNARSAALDIERTASGLDASASLLSRMNTELDYRARLFASVRFIREQLSSRDSLPFLRDDFGEWRGGFRAEADRMLFNHPVHASLLVSQSAVEFTWPNGDAHYSAYLARIGDSRILPQSPRGTTFLHAEARTRHAFRPDLDVDGGVALYLYRGTRTATSGRLYPFVTARYDFNTEVSAFAKLGACVSDVSSASLLAENPYLRLGAELRQRDTPVYFTLGVDVDARGPFSGRVTAAYSFSSSDYIWIRDPEIPAQWNLRYDGYTSIFILQGQGTWTIGPRDRVLGTALLRSSSNTAIHAAVPFLAPLEASGTDTREFPFGISASGALHLVGTRSTGDGNLPAVLLARVEGEYRVTTQLGAYACIDNLFGQQYEWWPGYEARPLFLSIGITVRL